MKATVDKAGRVVIPKSIRERNRLVPGTEVEILDFGDHIELILPDDRPEAVLIEKEGGLVIAEQAGRRETMDETLDLLDELRESRLG
ncbi:MAG TPA: AbrB/MazE/SpoVT family DNA-binding domain-containing protein [Acidimicrobiales bacterium]|nr:AbrB/MazE/SpoVT family DNA-binding domain-containing protein [Acidimicrobiales bacterium]